MQYDAFISYSHADGRIARALQSGLQRLAKPWFRRPTIRVFRDETSLSANPGLWSEIERNLGQSRYFILLASHMSAQSHWVDREAVWWADHQAMDRLLIVVTDGTIRWDSAANDFDWSATTSLPRSLAGRFKEEPLYANLTWATSKDDLSLRHSQFRAAILDLAAPVHGKPKDELDSEDIRQNRRLRTFTWSGVAIIVALAIGAIIAAWFAVQNANEAIRNAITATSRQYAVEAQLMLGQGRLADAVTSSLKAFRTEDTTEARSAVFQTFEAARDIHAVLRGHQSAVWAVQFRRYGTELLTWSADNVLIAWDVPARRASGVTRLGEAVDVRSAAFSRNGRVLAVGTADGSIRLWDTETMQSRGPLKGRDGSAVCSLAFDPAARLLAAAYDLGGGIVVWDLTHPESGPSPLERGENHPFATGGLSFSSDGRYLAATDETPMTSVAVWTIPAGKQVTSLSRTGRFSMNQRVVFVPRPGDDTLANDLVIGTSDGIVQTFRTSGGSRPEFQRLRSSMQHQGSVSVIAAGFASFATGGTDGLVSMFGPVSERWVTPASWSKASVRSLAFSENEDYLAAGATDGTVTVYYGRLQRPRTADVDTTRFDSANRSPRGRWIFRNVNQPGVLPAFTVADALTRRIALEGLRGHIVFSPDDRWVASSDGDNTALWDVSGQQPSREPVVHRKAYSVSFSPSGRFVVTRLRTNRGEIHVLDLTKSPPQEQTLQPFPPSGDVHGFSKDEQFLITIDGERLHLWDLARAERVGPTIALEPLDDDDEDAYRIELSADHRWLLAGRESGTLSLHRLAGSEGSRPFPVERFRAGRFSGDAKWFAATALDQDGLFDLATLTPLFRSTQKEHAAWWFTADSRWAIRNSRGLQVWNLHSKSPQATVLTRDPATVEWSQDERWALTRDLGDSGPVRLWNLSGDVPEGRTLPIKNPGAVLLTPDGDRLLTTERDGQPMTMWDVMTLQRHQIPAVSLARPTYALSPDGRTLAIEANGNGRIVLLRLPEGDVVGQLDGHTEAINDIEYSTDGTVLAAIDAGGSLSFWDAKGVRKLGDTLAGPGGKEDPDYRVKVDAQGRINGMPAHSSLWIEEVCSRTDPALSVAEWRRLFGTVAFPSTCNDVSGVTKDDLVQTAR